MSTMTKHHVVLHWYESINSDQYQYPPRLRVGEPQMFCTEETPQFALSPGTVVRMDYDTWQDMGGPVEITVTVEPGDLLNR